MIRTLLAMIALLQISIFFISLNGVQSFSTSVGRATTSSLFRPIRQPHQSISTTFLPTTHLRMSEDKDDGNEIEASMERDASASASASIDEETKKSPKERSGFLTALILGPPLIAKFGIVLLVKLATDLVVFPLLFLYRICKIAKNKIASLFTSDDMINGDGINGSS